MTVRKELDIVGIMEKIPHRYPMLLVDKIKDLNEKGCVGIKNVTMNESIFQGHFPSEPVFPGVLTIEAMAQTAGVFVMETLNESSDNHVVYFMSIDNVKFRRKIVPGDTVELHVEKAANKGAVWKFKGVAKVEDQICCQAEFKAMIVKKD